jgi:hypothetical protein
MKEDLSIDAFPITEKLRLQCRKKFLRNFSDGFSGEKYGRLERDSKWEAHLAWNDMLSREEFKRLLLLREYKEIAQRAVRIVSRTNLLLSFEKILLSDAIQSEAGAEIFSRALFSSVYPGEPNRKTFDQFARALMLLPRKQARVLTWPLQTIFTFIAQPMRHIFLEPRVTQIAAEHYRFPFAYKPQVNWKTYQCMIAFAEQVRADIADLSPRDMMDLQSFIRVQGAEEYG